MSKKIIINIAITAIILTCGLSLPAMNDVSGETKFFFNAIAQGDLNAVEKHVSENPTFVNAKDSLDCPVLIRSIETGNDAITLFLIQQKSDVNVPNGSGDTPLMGAIMREQLLIIHELIRAGAKRYAQNEELHQTYSIHNQFGQTIETILDAKSPRIRSIILEVLARATVGLTLHLPPGYSVIYGTPTQENALEERADEAMLEEAMVVVEDTSAEV